MKYVRKISDDYCVLDVETTGLSAKYDKIIEIGILKVKNDKVVDTYECLVNPGIELDNYITQLTGITNEMLSTAPKIEEIKDDVKKFIGNALIVGHNTFFDKNFIQTGFNEELENEYIDTLQFARKLYPELSHHSLDYLSNYLKLSKNGHRVIVDCTTTKELFEHIKKEMLRRKLTINEMWKKKKSHTHKSYKIDDIIATHEIDEDNFFYNKHCVFTGKLEKMVRKEAMQLVVNTGGILDKSVTKETNFLILGSLDYCQSLKGEKSKKQLKAEQYKLKGQNIEVIDEDTFYQLIHFEE